MANDFRDSALQALAFAGWNARQAFEHLRVTIPTTHSIQTASRLRNLRKPLLSSADQPSAQIPLSNLLANDPVGILLTISDNIAKEGKPGVTDPRRLAAQPEERFVIDFFENKISGINLIQSRVSL